MTIVLPVKGRNLFTLRFLWHANSLKLPYRFLIADGQVDEAFARHLEDSRQAFPDLEVEYIRYPNDTGYGRYFAKVADVLSRVGTPYAMLADNDDFLGVDGIQRALDFLDANPDYVAARGRPITFSVYSGFGNPGSGVYGSLNRFRTSFESEDGSADLVTERLRQAGLSHLIYYAVYRTDALATIWRDDAEIGFSDLMLHEVFNAMRALTLGKVKTDKRTISYFLQDGTSMSFDPLRDWARHLLRSRFTSEADEVVGRISRAAAAADGVGEAVVAEQVRTLLESHFRRFLSVNYGPVMRAKGIAHKKWPKLVKYWKTRPRFSVTRERAALLSQLAADGASDEGLRRIREDIEQIQIALSPAAFAIHARPFRAAAHTTGDRNWV